MLADCPDRLDADLRRVYPGASLDRLYDGTASVRAIASMTAYLPRGSAVWEYYGGQYAITAEVESAWLIEHATIMVASAKPEKVKPRPYPMGVHEQEQRENFATSRAEAWRKKQQARAAA